MQPVVTTLPVAAVQSLLAAESQQPGVVPVWLPGSGESLGFLGCNVFVAPPLVCRHFHDNRRHVCPQEAALGPQDSKSELDQFGKLFKGCLDCSTTDSKAALNSEERSSSLCSYELDVDAPKECVPVQDGTACTVAFVDSFSARRGVRLSATLSSLLQLFFTFIGCTTISIL
ncbi:unnamed protein product [Ixodes pacificus]